MIIKIGEGRYINPESLGRFAFNQSGYVHQTQIFFDSTQDCWQVGTQAITRDDYLLMLADIETAIANGTPFIDVSDYPVYHRRASTPSCPQQDEALCILSK